MIKTLQRRFALSRQGAVDLIKGCIACVVALSRILCKLRIGCKTE